MPTRSGVATVVIGVLALVSGRIFGIFELYIVAGVLLALVACAVAWVTLNWRSLHVTRAVAPARLHVGSNERGHPLADEPACAADPGRAGDRRGRR